jgi:ethanolamine permease
VIVFFIGAYLTAIFEAPLSAIVETPAAFQPVWWVLGYAIFVGLNTRGVELSFTITIILTLLAIAILLTFFVSAIPFLDFGKYAMNIGADPATGEAIELPDGNGPFLPFGMHGILAAMPFAVWLFLAIEQLPLAAEESADPRRDMPKGIMLGMFTLIGLGSSFWSSTLPFRSHARSPTRPASRQPFMAPSRSERQANRSSTVFA